MPLYEYECGKGHRFEVVQGPKGLLARRVERIEAIEQEAETEGS